MTEKRITPVHEPPAGAFAAVSETNGHIDPSQPPAAFAALAEKAQVGSAVVCELPDGRPVLLERPKGSIVARVLMIASELVATMKVEDAGGIMAQNTAVTFLKPYVEAIMHVKAVGDQKTAAVVSAEGYQRLADNLGDEGIEAIQAEIFKHWPPPGARDKSLVKKSPPTRPS